MITDYNQLSGLQKAAILFSVLGESLALTLVKGLSKTDIRKVRATIREMEKATFSVRKHVVEEFYFNFVSEKFQSADAEEPKKPFEFLEYLTDEQLVALLTPEEPRVVAIILAQVPVERRMVVMDRLAPEDKAQVLIELGDLNDIPLEAIVNVATDLREKSHFLPKTVNFSRGGGKEIAEILGSMKPGEEERYYEALTKEDPELAREIRKYYLTFDDIFKLFHDELLRNLMNSVELDTIALAMKGLPDDIVERAIGILSKRKQAMYEPVEGPVTKRDVDTARKTIVQVARQMEKDGAYRLEELAGGVEMIE